MSLTKDFKVAIIGGGMCGLACAVALSRSGIQVDMFESAPRFQEVGAGVGLGPNAIRALEGLGVLDAVLSRADQPKPSVRPFTFLSGLPGHEHIYTYSVHPSDQGLGIHRAAFLEALEKLVDPSITHFNKRCTSISTPDVKRSIVHFADGTTHEADVVIGADGIRSIARKSVIGESGPRRLVFTNTVAYRALIPTETLKHAGVQTDLTPYPHCFVGRDRHIITFPIKGGQIINVVAFATNRQVPMPSEELPPGQPWVTPVSEQELLEDFNGWGDDTMGILSSMKKPSKWSIHALNPPLESYVKGRVVLVGDAAHGMLPHLGAGVGQGFEDVLVLTRLLTHPGIDASNVHDALQAYDHVRPARANEVLRSSTAAGDLYEAYDHHGYTAEEMRERLTGLWSPVWHHDLEGDIAKAIEFLK